jgi:transcription antitermination factor NusG
VIPNGGTPPELYLDSHWFVFGTRARAEKQVERMIRHAGIEVFLPLVERESRWADRVKRIGFPLFPSYVFVHFRLAELNDVLPLPGVTGVLTPNGYPTPVREEEMDSLRRLVHGSSVSGVVPAPTPTDLLRPGSEVRVVSGPFEGMRGILLEDRGRTRVAVYIAALRQAASVELPREAVAPLGEELSA